MLSVWRELDIWQWTFHIRNCPLNIPIIYHIKVYTNWVLWNGIFFNQSLVSIPGCYRLCARDSHQLYQRLESHAIDYILEVKVKLLQQLTSGHSTPDQAKAFMCLLLEEYTALCASSKILSEIFKQLVSGYNTSLLSCGR